MTVSVRKATFVSPPTSFEFARVAVDNEGTAQPHVVFKNNYGTLEVPVENFLKGEYSAWKDRTVLTTHQVERAAAAIVTLGL